MKEKDYEFIELSLKKRIEFILIYILFVILFAVILEFCVVIDISYIVAWFKNEIPLYAKLLNIFSWCFFAFGAIMSLSLEVYSLRYIYRLIRNRILIRVEHGYLKDSKTFVYLYEIPAIDQAKIAISRFLRRHRK